jgi:hypothetical protein
MSELTLPAIEQTRVTPRRGPLLRDLLIVALHVAILLGIMEATLRVMGVQYQSEFYLHDGTRGWMFVPGLTGWNTLEHAHEVTINSAGFHDRERPIHRPAGVPRIAVLGDSFAAAMPVSQPETLTAVAERTLGHGEVLNFGVTGYNLAQCRTVLRDVVWRYDPQIVVLLLTLDGGIHYNVRALAAEMTGAAPFYVLRNNQLVADEETQRAKATADNEREPELRRARLLNSSRLALLVRSRYEQARQKFGTFKENRLSRPQYMGLTYSQFQRDKFALWPYFPEQNQYTADAWRVAERTILEIRADVEKHGSEFWVVVSTLPKQIDPDRKERERFRKSIGAPSLYLPNERLARFAERENIRLIDLSLPLGEYAAQHGVVLHGFGARLNEGHWNVAGNEAAGKVIATRLMAGSTKLKSSQHTPLVSTHAAR